LSAPATDAVREKSFGQDYAPTLVDRFGVWLSARQIYNHVRSFQGLRVGDFGCGYHAQFLQTVLADISQAVLVDVSLSPKLKSNPKVRAIEGTLPDALSSIPSGSLDVVLCVSVLEHLWEPLHALLEFRRLLASDGICFVNVPSWRGKQFLEYSAFRLKTSPADEMNDHKMYYDPRDLWPLLIRAGFKPQGIVCKEHKFGLNTYAACRAS
jgi:SAM-dependent methyltransferase